MLAQRTGMFVVEIATAPTSLAVQADPTAGRLPVHGVVLVGGTVEVMVGRVDVGAVQVVVVDGACCVVSTCSGLVVSVAVVSGARRSPAATGGVAARVAAAAR
ncbi:hypothetical protein C1Y40_02105 [Mycobacterium talmoniae]|uniref:Uncharacterized protein n=1 Tax=Mycobacterium talmoniae TaxID=1858794 RepID=A0A2S8BM04_9MYCO|nr:hypothetical protein C1Y40_02105 [Mycobacterium talmoniae]